MLSWLVFLDCLPKSVLVFEEISIPKDGCKLKYQREHGPRSSIKFFELDRLRFVFRKAMGLSGFDLAKTKNDEARFSIEVIAARFTILEKQWTVPFIPNIGEE